jgi:hypothetical protein
VMITRGMLLLQVDQVEDYLYIAIINVSREYRFQKSLVLMRKGNVKAEGS